MVDATNSYTCGASLVSDDLLISAAHCFAAASGGGLTEYTSITAKIGVIDTTQPSSPTHVYETREVVCVKLHPDYSAFTFANDLAMLKLDSALPSTYVPVETAGAGVDQSGDFLVAGWGGLLAEGLQTPESSSDVLSPPAQPAQPPPFRRHCVVLTRLLQSTDPNDDAVAQVYPNVLQIGATSSITREECIAKYGASNIGDGHICGAPDTGIDACYGDSGGPLFKNTGTTQVLYGVVSWGLG
jgi:trypsin